MQTVRLLHKLLCHINPDIPWQKEYQCNKLSNNNNVLHAKTCICDLTTYTATFDSGPWKGHKQTDHTKRMSLKCSSISRWTSKWGDSFTASASYANMFSIYGQAWDRQTDNDHQYIMSLPYGARGIIMTMHHNTYSIFRNTTTLLSILLKIHNYTHYLIYTVITHS